MAFLFSAVGCHPGVDVGLKATVADAEARAGRDLVSTRLTSSPILRIQAGSRGVFSVGQEVPVLGVLSFPQGAGQAVQSVVYRSSGVIFDIQPTVRGEIIDLNINQKLSDFFKTMTRVNSSPP